MKKSTKIKFALLPGILLIPTAIGISLSSCTVEVSSPEENKPVNPPVEQPNPIPPSNNDQIDVDNYIKTLENLRLNATGKNKKISEVTKENIPTLIENWPNPSNGIEMEILNFSKDESKNNITINFQFKKGNYSSVWQTIIDGFKTDEQPKPEPNPEQKYEIKFKDENTFEIGNPQKRVYEVTQDDLKKIILENKQQIFEIPNNISNFDWNTNLIIGQFFGDADLGEMTFDLTLNNSSNINKKSITKNIKISGFWTIAVELKQEIKRINQINDLNLIQTQLNDDELAWLDENSILYYLTEKFNNKSFEYNSSNFEKNTTNKTISFNIQAKYVDKELQHIQPLQSKQFILKYEIVQKQTNYSVEIKLKNQEQQNNYGQWIDLEANLNTKSKLYDFEWSINDANDNAEITPEKYSNEAILASYSEGNYTITINVKTKNGITIATNSLTLNLNKEYYNISFIDEKEPIVFKNENISENLPSYYQSNKDELKRLIAKKQNDIFINESIIGSGDITDIIDENISNNFQNNLIINNISPDDQIGKLTANITLNNATSNGESITGNIIMFGFKKTLTDDQLLLNVLSNTKLEPNKPIGHMTAQEGATQVHTLFTLDEVKAKQSGASLYLTSNVDHNKESQIILNLTASLLTDQNVEKKEIRYQDGFFVNKQLGELDKTPNQKLKTPSGWTDYKKAETIRQLNTSYMDTGDWFTKANRFGWDQYEKEMVYQARFALYQSFQDNFTEINYYAKTDEKNIHVIAEGVIKNDFNKNYIVQTTQEMAPRYINLKANEILRVEYIVPKTNEKSFYPTTVTTPFSFSKDSMNLDMDPGFWKVFGMQLPGYHLNIQTMNENGSVKNNWWNHYNNKMRSFVFSISAMQGKKTNIK